jgi:hypothetical protein
MAKSVKIIKEKIFGKNQYVVVVGNVKKTFHKTKTEAKKYAIKYL